MPGPRRDLGRVLDAAHAEHEVERAGSAGIEVGLAFVHLSGASGWLDQPEYLPHLATLGGALPRAVGTRNGT